MPESVQLFEATRDNAAPVRLPGDVLYGMYESFTFFLCLSKEI